MSYTLVTGYKPSYPINAKTEASVQSELSCNNSESRFLGAVYLLKINRYTEGTIDREINNGQEGGYLSDVLGRNLSSFLARLRVRSNIPTLLGFSSQNVLQRG